MLVMCSTLCVCVCFDHCAIFVLLAAYQQISEHTKHTNKCNTATMSLPKNVSDAVSQRLCFSNVSHLFPVNWLPPEVNQTHTHTHFQ